MDESSWLEIDLAKLQANLQVIRGMVGPAVQVCGVVKADAYGLGAVQIAKRLVISGVDMLAVYSPTQAAELVRQGITCDILILMPMRDLQRADPLFRAAVSGKLHLSVQDEPHIKQIDAIGHSFGCRLNVHLHLDTGMSRTGLDEEQLARVAALAMELKYLRVVGLYTHFAAADDDVAFTNEQMDRFERALQRHRQALGDNLTTHVANTFATHRSRRFHQSMVRVGLGLYGYGSESLQGQPQLDRPQPLQPIVRLLSRIVHVQRYPKGAVVGYNCTHRLKRNSVLGVLPVGYGDGYPPALGNRACVRVLTAAKPVLAPIVGKINMDQIIIDLTGAKAPAVSVGDLVELISAEADCPCGVPALARLAKSSCYEMLCRLSRRIPRRYV